MWKEGCDRRDEEISKMIRGKLWRDDKEESECDKCEEKEIKGGEWRGRKRRATINWGRKKTETGRNGGHVRKRRVGGRGSAEKYMERVC